MGGPTVPAGVLVILSEPTASNGLCGNVSLCRRDVIERNAVRTG